MKQKQTPKYREQTSGFQGMGGVGVGEPPGSGRLRGTGYPPALHPSSQQELTVWRYKSFTKYTILKFVCTFIDLIQDF